MRNRIIFLGLSVFISLYAHGEDCREIFGGPMRPQVVTLPSVSVETERAHFRFLGMKTSLVNRSAVRYENGALVVVHDFSPSRKSSLQESRGHWKKVAENYGGGAVNFDDADAIENSPIVNCHEYACLINHIPGLPVGWMEIDANFLTENTKPLQTVLESFFTKIKTLSPSRLESLADDATLEPNDLVTFVSNGGNVHSGVIIVKDGKNFIRSKFGSSATVDLPPQMVGAHYAFNKELEIWRRKK